MPEEERRDSESAGRAQEPAYVIGLGGAVVLRLSAHGVLLAFLAAGVFSALTAAPGPSPTSIGWVRPLLYVVVYFGVIVVHELVHGLFFRIFGGSPRYGAGIKYFMPYFYVTSSGAAFSVRQVIVIGLAPLLTLSSLALVGAFLAPSLAGYLAVAFIGNTAGAVGDIWMTSRLVKFLPLQNARVVDLVDGMAVHSTDPRAREIAEKLSATDKRPTGFVVHWIGATLAVFAAAGLMGAVGPYFTDSLLIGPAQMPLLVFENSSGSATWTFNLASPLLAGLAFAIAMRLFSRRAKRVAELPPVG